MPFRLRLSSPSCLLEDSYALLHELMYRPAGTMHIREVRKALYYDMSNDIRKLMMYCSQNDYIQWVGEYISLTDSGLQYYLQYGMGEG